MICNLQAQKVVYELSTGSKEKYEAEDINICFAKIEKQAQDSGIHESSILAIAASAIIPTVIKAGFKLSDSLFAKNVRKYKAEYFRFQSYLENHHLRTFEQ